MPSFLFAFVAVALCSLGARDQLLVAQLAEARSKAGGLLAVALPVAALSAAFMGWAGAFVADLLPDAAAAMLVAFALLAAAFELAWPNRERAPREPTHSLFALGIVLLARQLSDAARFLVFAFAAATGVPLLAALGGALGGMAALVLAIVLKGELLAKWPLRPLRLALSALVGLAGVIIGLSARGLL